MAAVADATERTCDAPRRMVFCDFDGTITVNETFVGMIERFAPQRWAEIKADIYSLKLSHHHIPLVVVSGGLRGMVETVLDPWRGYLAGIHAAEIDDQGEFLQVYSEFEGETELVAKARVLEHYGPLESVAIGDSVTDLSLALRASLVFAREPLSQYLRERQRPFIPWLTFFDIQHHLVDRWGLI